MGIRKVAGDYRTDLGYIVLVNGQTGQPLHFAAWFEGSRRSVTQYVGEGESDRRESYACEFRKKFT